MKYFTIFWFQSSYFECFGIWPKMTLKSKKVQNISTLNITWVHFGFKMGFLKEILLLEVYVWGGGWLFWAVFTIKPSHAVHRLVTFEIKYYKCIDITLWWFMILDNIHNCIHALHIRLDKDLSKEYLTRKIHKRNCTLIFLERNVAYI